jgi:hypothetical protein
MSDESGTDWEWQTPQPIRYTATWTSIENGLFVERPVKFGEIIGGRYDGFRIPPGPGVEWSADGQTFTQANPEVGGTNP